MHSFNVSCSSTCDAHATLQIICDAAAAVARLVKEVFDTAAGNDAVNAVSDYLRSQRVTSLADLQVRKSNLYLQPWGEITVWKGLVFVG